MSIDQIIKRNQQKYGEDKTLKMAQEIIRQH
jgi:hypothetical protein